ncbi:MAG: hypothetical protein Q8P41_18905 [Pseudomonadota bacterium]|nr:hypothetical protein [Pseudomonadota bacterium]
MSGRYAPGPRAGRVPVVPRAASMALSLEAELEGALTDAIAGDPPGPMLAGRLERLAREILLRRGLGAARVVARSDARETTVHVVLPPDAARVREVVVRIGSAL